jgi:capsule polysaccharide export protein KpsE/RkpR
MKSIALLLSFLILGACFAHADAQPTAFEKALYEKARYSVLGKVSDEDLVSYCVSMNIGGDTLTRLHDEIMEKQVELSNLQSEGMTNDNAQVQAVNAALKSLRAQYSIKIAEVRKALELEASIADATLSQLPK